MEMVNVGEFQTPTDSKVIKKVPILTNQLISTIFSVGVNSEIPAHLHSEFDEIHYIIDGSGKVTVGKESKSVSKGMLLLIPKSKTHYFSTKDEKLTILSFSLVSKG